MISNLRKGEIMKIEYKDALAKLIDLKRTIDLSTRVDSITKTEAKDHIDAVVKIIQNPIAADEAHELKFEVEEHLSQVQDVPDVQSYAETYKSIFSSIIDDKVIHNF